MVERIKGLTSSATAIPDARLSSMVNRFCHYELRTTDVNAARDFYSDLLGWSFWGEGIDVVPLPAQASARGAPPHWLGHIGIDNVAETVGRFVQHGATPLGPPVRTDGAE